MHGSSGPVVQEKEKYIGAEDPFLFTFQFREDMDMFVDECVNNCRTILRDTLR